MTTFLHKVFDLNLLESAEDVAIQPNQVVSIRIRRNERLWRLTYTPRVAPGLRVTVDVEAHDCAFPNSTTVSLIRGAGPEHPEVVEFFDAATERAMVRAEEVLDQKMLAACNTLFPEPTPGGA